MKKKCTIKSILSALCLLLSVGVTTNAQTFEWAKALGGGELEQSKSISIDGHNNVYITGHFGSDTADFNPGGTGGLLFSAGNRDIFLAKYDAAGNYLWSKSSGGSGLEEGTAVASDKHGNVYMTGHFKSDTIDLNPGGTGGVLLNRQAADVFLVKYDSSGAYLWSKNFGGSQNDEAQGIALDDSGNVYITGNFTSDTIDVNPGGTGGILTAINKQPTIFLVKYNPDGDYVWSKKIGGKQLDFGTGLATDHNGNLYITGYLTSDTADFNPGHSGGIMTSPLSLSSSYFIFLAKYTSDGTYVWSKDLGGGDNDDYGRSIAIDSKGDIYLTGEFSSSSADFNPGGSGGVLTAKGVSVMFFPKYTIFLAKYDSSGNYLWAQALGGDESNWGHSVVTDGADNVYLSGATTSDTADFNPNGSGGLLTGGEAYLVKYNTEGDYLWGISAGGSSSGVGFGTAFSKACFGIAVDGSGNLYGTGYFINADSLDFSSGTGGALFPIEKGDAFLVKFACDDTALTHLTITTCEASYTLNDSTYTTDGTYTQVFTSSSGCDSTVTLDLTLTPVPQPVININHFTLGIAGSYPYTTYQWIKDGSAITGATDSTYVVTVNGDYQVAVSNEEGCTDTSDIYSITNAGIADEHDLAGQVQVYPNPTEDKVFIQAPIPVTATLTDITGKTIQEMPTAQSIPLGDLADGIYLLRISNQKGMLIKVVKVVKQEP